MKPGQVTLPALALLASLVPGTASAAGSVWARALRPDVRRELAAEAQGHEVKAQHLQRSRSELDHAEVVTHLARAAILLEAAGAATSPDPFLRYRLAQVYVSEGEEELAKAVPLLESIAMGGPERAPHTPPSARVEAPPALRALVFADLAVAYAHLGRVEDEIAAYGRALRVQPVAFERARLLANRAEAYMLLGNIIPAVNGYRAALGLLSADHMMFGTGPTTLWGLGVALDRSGDLDSGLDAIRVARSYDAQDKLITGRGWFYMPELRPVLVRGPRPLAGGAQGRGGDLGAGRRLRPRRRLLGRVHHRGRRPRRPLAPARPHPRQAVRERAGRLPPPPALAQGSVVGIFPAPRNALRIPVRPFTAGPSGRRVRRRSFRMRRDSLYGEPVLWSGRPKEVSSPALYRVATAVCAATSAITTASAVVVAQAFPTRPGGMLAFAAWMATLAFAFGFGPRWWGSQLEFIVTDRHVIIRRGRMRRSIEIRQISYARIHWSPRMPGIGDLELVRAVPTGALRRRLSIVLHGLIAPDRVWAIMRGVTPTAPGGDGHRLLAQRLDEGERVLWSAHPVATWRRWIPTGARSFGSIGIALLVGGAAGLVSAHAAHALQAVVAGGWAPVSPHFMALAVSLSLVVVLLVSASVGLLYAVVIRPARLSAQTRYLITDRRVLIQRGDEELHLDRARIVDVIDTPTDGAEGGVRDLFLVLDGPRARAVAASGAFGEAGGQGLQPVLYRVADAEAVHGILQESRGKAVAVAA